MLVAVVDDTYRALDECADPDQADAMSAYMRHQFSFFGVKAPGRRSAQRPLITAGTGCGSSELLEAADRCWGFAEREMQYVGADLLRRWAPSIESAHIERVARLITTKSWWDTVDALAAHVVGPMVRSDPRLVDVMDRWIRSDDMWLARTAILHQLSFKAGTDGNRLFEYVDITATDDEFFIRKAAGWALRTYARIEPDRVRRYVDGRGDALSPLTRREALKHLAVDE